METVLPVEYVEFDHSVEETGDISQMSAEEYLSWVRHQASQLPTVFRANVTKDIPARQSKYMPDVEAILQCPNEYLPNEEWEIDIIHSFSELRNTLSRLSAVETSRERLHTVPQMKDNAAWHRFCLAGDLNKETQAEISTSTGDSSECGVAFGTADAIESVTGRKRQLAQSLGLSSNISEQQSDGTAEDGEEINCEDVEDVGEEYCFPDTNQDLAYCPDGMLPKWTGAENVSPTTTLLLQLDQVLTQKVLGYHINWLESRSLTPNASQWIYSLLARLEKPICQATVATIRQLYRRCCYLRHQLTSDDSSADAAIRSSTFDADLAALNILISITGAYFGQGEAYVAFNHQNYSQLMQQQQEDEEDDDCFDMDEDDEGIVDEGEVIDVLCENNGKRARKDTASHSTTGSRSMEVVGNSSGGITTSSVVLESGECLSD